MEWNNAAFAQLSNASTDTIGYEDLQRMVETLLSSPRFGEPVNYMLLTPERRNQIRWWRFGDARRRARLSTQKRRTSVKTSQK